MTLDYISLLILLGVLALGAVLLLSPKTSAFLKKNWWLFVAALLAVAGVVMLRRKPSQSDGLDEASDGGDKFRKDSLESFDAIVDAAAEKASFADAELRVAKIAANEERDQAFFQVHAIKSISDPTDRRKALAKLLSETK